ncbi:MAG: hypothetical protein U1E22_00750 [Coriobacteriia bacterium]|nr:hypothetical protein [Coriobacteriia bacterium]
MKKLVVVGILIVAVVFGLVAYASADTVNLVVGGNPLAGSGNVTVRAVVNPRLTVSITTPDAAQTVDFGSLNPGDNPADKNVVILVSSNKAFQIDKAMGSTNLAANLSMTMTYPAGLDVANGVKGANTSFTDIYHIPAVAWTVDPGTYVDTVTYTVTQN